MDIESKYFERSMYQGIPKFYKIYRKTISKEVYKTMPRKFTQGQWEIIELHSCSYALDRKQYAVMKELSKKNCKKANNLIDKLVSNFKKDLEIKLIPETKEKMLIELEQTITKLRINDSSLFLKSEIEQMNEDIKDLILKEYMDLDQSIYEYRKMIFERHEIELN
jgi:hypothetical protein